MTGKADQFRAYLLEIVSAHSEEDEDRILSLLDPGDRYTMGPIYEEYLGYNPIDWFDQEYAYEAFKDIVSQLSDTEAVRIRSERDAILAQVMSDFNADREANLHTRILEEISRLLNREDEDLYDAGLEEDSDEDTLIDPDDDDEDEDDE